MIRYPILCAFLAGCGAALDGAAGGPRSGDDGAALDASAPVSLDAASARPASSLASMTELLCGGPCPPGAFGSTSEVVLVLSRPRPAYQVTIQADGTVLYQGHRFVKVRGPAEGHVDPAEVRRLVQRFEDAGFRFDRFDVSASPCGESATDRPATTLTLVRGQRQLRVVRRACESGPFSLADEIDAVAGTARWVQCEPGAPAPCEQ
jgi:Domain of unknown function (DUF6438)